MNGVKFSRVLFPHGVPQSSVSKSALFNIFINELDERIKCTLSNFAVNIKSSENVDLLEGRKPLNRWAEANCEVHQGQMPGPALGSQ